MLLTDRYRLIHRTNYVIRRLSFRNQKLDLNALGETELGKQLKTKACNVVLDQGKSYLGLG